MSKLKKIMFIASCVLGIVLLNIGFIFLLLAMLPSITAYFIDDTDRKDLFKTVRATNLAGMLPILIKLSGTYHAAASLQIAMTDPKTWLIVYGFAAVGYILVWICRWVSYFSMIAAGEARILYLEGAQKQLVEEWGDDIKEFVIEESKS